jgi:Sap-like sulfolipid-1-addressing protein
VSGPLLYVVLLGVACAANPWGMMIAVLLLEARRPGVVWAYVLAWVASLSVGLAVLVVGFGAVVESGSSSASTASAVIQFVLGVALAAWGVERVIDDRRAPSAGVIDDSDEPALPGWIRAIENISYVPAFLLGIYSATWPMVIAAAGEIVSAGGSTAQTVALCVLFVALGSSTVVAIAAIGTFTDRSDALLARLRTWLTVHSRAVITTILLVLGAVLVARGLGTLL